MLYRRGGVWWYKFRFAGRLFRESTKSRSKTIAQQAERKRRQSLEESLHGIKKRSPPITLSAAADDWLKLKKPTLARKSFELEEGNLRNHLKPALGSMLLIDITADDVADYQRQRRKAGASPKTVNLELGTLRGILKRHRFWANLQPDVKMLQVRENVGKALSSEEEARLIAACATRRSRMIEPMVTLALHTGMRRGEIQSLLWRQVDFLGRTVTVGESKTESGAGRVIPLNDRAFTTLQVWATNFPGRQPEHCLFPSERYGFPGKDGAPNTKTIDPTKPTREIKTAWKSAKAGVRCRFHDLRHTACTRLLERGAPLPVVAAIFGWSAGTTAKMAKRYGHIGTDARRAAVASLDGSWIPTTRRPLASELSAAENTSGALVGTN